MTNLPDFTTDIYGNSLQFRGNINLKNVNQPLPYTIEHIKEIKKCREDICYFAENYYYIVHPDKGRIKLPLRDFQRDFLRNFQNERRLVINASRQCGKCVTGDTKILIRKNNIIKEIKIKNLMKSSLNIQDNKFTQLEYLNDYYVLSENNEWIKINKILKTKPYQIWEIKTKTGLFLKCADKHIIIDENNKEIFVKDLKIGDKIKTINGIDIIISLKKINKFEEMYDLELSDKHIYFTNGILSHNTTIVACALLHFALFNKDKTVAILANKDAQAKEILKRLQLAYEMMPKWLQQGIVHFTKHSILLENGTEIITAATSSSSIRGRTISLLVLDEFAFVPHGIAQDFLSAVMPTISASKTARVVIISTPNGLNHFYKFCIDAKEKRNDYVYFEVPWYDIPGRDENWKLQTIRNECNNDIERFKQEYECEFNAGSETLIESAKIKTLAYKNPIKEETYEVHNKTFYINIYEEPKPGHIYIMPIDSAKGGGDACAFHLIDVTEKPFKQVVAFREDKLSHLDYPEIILKYAKKYNNAFIIVENNEIGQEIADKLWYEYEYENLWNENDKKNVGFRTTTKSKRIGMSTLKGYVENDILLLNDFDTISELSHFKKKGTTFKGDGDFDDLTMALVFFSYFTTTITFDDLVTHGVDTAIQKQMEENEGEPDIVLSDYDEEDEFLKMLKK